MIYRLPRAVYTEADWRYVESDDLETKAWKAGFLHAYRGLDAGWIDKDTQFMYDLGRQDGEAERDRTIARGERDPRDW